MASIALRRHGARRMLTPAWPSAATQPLLQPKVQRLPVAPPQGTAQLLSGMVHGLMGLTNWPWAITTRSRPASRTIGPPLRHQRIPIRRTALSSSSATAASRARGGWQWKYNRAPLQCLLGGLEWQHEDSRCRHRPGRPGCRPGDKRLPARSPCAGRPARARRRGHRHGGLHRRHEPRPPNLDDPSRPMLQTAKRNQEPRTRNQEPSTPH